MIYVFIWWLIVEFFGWLALPAAYRIFRWLPDRGYAFSKALALLLITYVLWMGATTGFLHNSRGGILVAIVVVGALSAWLYFRYPKRGSGEDGAGERESLLDFLREHKGMIFSVEALFTLGFIVWAVLRAYAAFKIDTAGGEKYMEVAFLNSILRSVHFPPADPWLSGFSISYYYFGYVMMAMMTRLSGAPVGIGFDLYDSLLFALTLVGAFGVVYNLIPVARRARGSKPTFGSGQPIRYALLGALLLVVMGNLSGFFESVHSTGLVSDSFWKWLDQPTLLQQGVKYNWPASAHKNVFSWVRSLGLSLEPKDNGWFWWWRGSRVVDDHDLLGATGNENITEFPFFSFVLGDNHPHVLDLPFVLMAVGLALNLLRRQLSRKEELEHELTRNDTKDAKGNAKEDLEHEITRNNTKDAKEETPLPDEAGVAVKKAPWWDPVASCLDGDWALFLIMALALGALGFLNTWDFPIYLIVVSVAYWVGLYATNPMGERRRSNWQLVGRAFTLGVGLGIFGALMYILFWLGFSSQAGGILPFVLPPTELRQYFVMFGPFLIILTVFLAVFLVRSAKQEGWHVLVKTLLGWLIFAASLLALYTLLLLFLSLLDMLVHITNNGVVRQALSNLSVTAALGKSLAWRLRDPWLLLWLTGLITFAASNLYWHVRAAARAADTAGEGGSEPSGQEDSDQGQGDSTTGRGDPAPTRPDRARSAPPRLSPSVLFVLLLVILGVGLTLSVEFVYLRDVFNTRMNTMFKFYYQGWVMMACASAYGIWWMLNRGDKVAGPVVKYSFVTVSALIVLAGLFYPVFAFYDRWTSTIGMDTSKPYHPNLDGASSLAQRNPDDWAAISWLNKNISGTPTILEAPGGSYTYEGRISALTGLPDVLGWSAHEDQWRGSYVEQGKRQPDIDTIYTTRDDQKTLDLLHKWNVSYVVVGDTERNYIAKLCAEPANSCNAKTAYSKFDNLLIPVFTGTTKIYAVP